ncbi:hypothetical protein [Benzoatithermus flavus]|uniref:Alpha/beta hydrolase n=1 Tax=Benzoatithermus flavus TaxID=3108223 RepID=A0ABU8XYL1_9PROT
MGGLLACALGTVRQADLPGLALLATPWNFRADRSPTWLLPGHGLLSIAATIAMLGHAPVDLSQSFFAHLDPVRVIRKFARFADMPADGVAPADPVAQECLWH